MRARRFYEVFPEDNRVAITLTNAAFESGGEEKAVSVYAEFKNRLWREHRNRPDFRLE